MPWNSRRGPRIDELEANPVDEHGVLAIAQRLLSEAFSKNWDRVRSLRLDESSITTIRE